MTRATSLDYGRPRRPLAVRIANHGLGALGRGLEADLTAGSLLERARRRTGLADPGDGSFREPMDVLLAAVEREARLHPVGRLMQRENLVRVLGNRLRVEEAVRLNPCTLDARPDDPVLVTGLQRTGTTLLHRLLAVDPRFRFLAAWEAVNPAPRGPRDTRIRDAKLAHAAVRWLSPDFAAIHPIEAEGPEEDVLLLELAFMSTVPESLMRVPSYSRWLEEADHTEAYGYMGKLLALLALGGSAGRWLLKSPHHLEHLDAFLEVFPRARVVQTHRDPAVTLPSFCSMIAHARAIFTDDVDPEEIGHHFCRKQLRMVTRAMHVREKAGDRFLDVMYRDLVATPLVQVRRVYDFLGLDLAPDVEERMRLFVIDNPKHKHGVHRYALGPFGLTRHEVDRSFAQYRARFAIPGDA